MAFLCVSSFIESLWRWLHFCLSVAPHITLSTRGRQTVLVPLCFWKCSPRLRCLTSLLVPLQMCGAWEEGRGIKVSTDHHNTITILWSVSALVLSFEGFLCDFYVTKHETWESMENLCDWALESVTPRIEPQFLANRFCDLGESYLTSST